MQGSRTIENMQKMHLCGSTFAQSFPPLHRLIAPLEDLEPNRINSIPCAQLPCYRTRVRDLGLNLTPYCPCGGPGYRVRILIAERN
jgi:hypothetical protein